MRPFLPCLALLAALPSCGSEENTVLSGYPPAIISPVRSSISAAATFTDASGSPRPHWVIAMSDVPDLCTKVTAHHDYFQTPIENFVAILVWVPAGNVGNFFVGQPDPTSGAVPGNEVLVGTGPAGATPRIVRLPGVAGFGANIGLSQFGTGPGGEASGSFDVVISDPNGSPREYIGRFKATYCSAFEQAQLP